MTGPVAASVESISNALRGFFTAEQVAAEDGLLQRRDPRAALCLITGLALAVMLTRTLTVLLILGLVTAGLAKLSSVSLRRLLARSVALPLFSAFVVLPQAVLLPGDALVSVFGLTVTADGLAYVVTFTLRVGIGVSLLSLLVLTTPFSDLVAAMRDLRVPIALVWVFAVTYRYLFLFFDELQRLILARNSRTTGTAGGRTGWTDARRIAGTFLLRSLDRGERVGRGMRARGGSRPPSPYRRSQSLDTIDYLLVALAVIAILGSGVLRWIP